MKTMDAIAQNNKMLLEDKEFKTKFCTNNFSISIYMYIYHSKLYITTEVRN